MATIKPKLNANFNKFVVTKPFKHKIEEFDYEFKSDEVKHIGDKKEAHEIAAKYLEKSKNALIEAHEKLWASQKYGILIVLQGMDTAGKDGTIRHILSGVNPQGCRIQGFKTPTTDEHLHDFMWRYQKEAPKRGEIVVFNRSHYEDVLVTQVHPEFMEKLPQELSVDGSNNFWDNRYEDINAWEKHLARNGIIVLKFYLHISHKEQTKRLLDRLTHEDKYWKISPADLKERNYWDKYMDAYESCISNTGKEYAPWIVVPSNDKKIARAIVAYAIADAIEDLDINFPEPSAETIKEIQTYKAALEKDLA